MKNVRPQILVIEDDTELLEGYVIKLEEFDEYEIIAAEGVPEARTCLQSYEFDVILSDLKLDTAKDGGLTILNEVKAIYPDTQVIIFTAIGGTEDARLAERRHVDGFMQKPLDFENLHQVINRAIDERKRRIALRTLVRDRRRNKKQHIELPTPDKLIYACMQMTEIVVAASKIAKSYQNVLIIGEPGTGKGLIAEGIHFGSGRSKLELINCGSLSERSLESLIFGGAREKSSDAMSLFERVDGGTLVLDRVSGLSIPLQERLYEFFANEHDERNSPLDIRLIGIDESNLELEVKQGLFLEELRLLLAGEILEVPPLRARKDKDYKDVLVVAEYYIKKYINNDDSPDLKTPNLSAHVVNIFEHYPFPGNIGELARVIRIGLSNSKNGDIKPEHLPPRIRRYGIQTDLGKLEEDIAVGCPHGDFLCNQTDVIANAYRGLNGVYLRLEDGHVDAISQIISNLGLNILLPEKVDSALSSMCSICIPIQACQYAILDLSHENSAEILYEVGMLHTLGIPTLLVTNDPNNVSLGLNKSQIKVFEDEKYLCLTVEQWINNELIN